MSHWYGLRCADCNDFSDRWFNHSFQLVQEVVRDWARVKPVFDLVKKTNGEVGYTLELDWQTQVPEGDGPEHFLSQHGYHNLQLADEYGYCYPLNCEHPQINVNSLG